MIVLRNTKGSPLTVEEMDNNFREYRINTIEPLTGIYDTSAPDARLSYQIIRPEPIVVNLVAFNEPTNLGLWYDGMRLTVGLRFHSSLIGSYTEANVNYASIYDNFHSSFYIYEGYITFYLMVYNAHRNKWDIIDASVCKDFL